MEITVLRKYFSEKSTIGELLIQNKRFCFTLEDRVREGPKVPKETAIPEGRYQVIIDFSNRFQRDMPHILDVPGFEGIRIHSGNTDKDTEGCLLLGLTRGVDFVGNSKTAFGMFFEFLKSALTRESVYVTITHEEPESA
jgi:hypothetical protein